MDYKNEKGDYVDAWWNTVNWKDVAARYKRARDTYAELVVVEEA